MHWKRFLCEIAIGAGNLLESKFGKVHKIEIKRGAGIVTEADKSAEQYLLNKIYRKYPESSIITEESGEFVGSHDLKWIIDPLDGTSNYAHGYGWYCVSIGLYVEGKGIAAVVYHPTLKELFYTERSKGVFVNDRRVKVSNTNRLETSLLSTGFYYSKGKELAREMKIFQSLNEKVLGVRRPGAAALDLAYVASGRFDGFWERGLAPWDVAAGLLMVTEAGGTITNYSGQVTSIFGVEVVASNKKLHRRLLNAIQKADKGAT